MKTHPVIQFLDSISPLTPEAGEDLSELFKSVELKKNEYLCREGDRVYNGYFLIDGVIRVFYSK